MILISAQPDDDYFIWQLRVQIDNLRRLHNKNEYHILVRTLGARPNPNFMALRDELEGSPYKIFFYLDTRPDWGRYLPSLRPHILGQHFHQYDLKEVFYMDSDIIFRELIDFDNLPIHHYVSDTVSYIGAEYILSKSRRLFEEMCQLVGIEPSVVTIRQKHSGGAQYLMRNIDAAFWQKVETDAINLYLYMEEFNKTYNGHKIQSWTADMWSVLWNLWLSDLDCKVNTELDFCWPTQLIAEWDRAKIMHNAGVTKDRADKLFYKASFIKDNPLNWDLSYVDKNYCSYKYVEAIELTKQAQCQILETK